ncbi:hypothetical protein GCM10017602_35440 [Herbiconiux flava]|nr:hypothetical protein GCM10017602_35440 [Herbiconiux flava]
MPVSDGRVFGAVGVPEPAAGAEIVAVLAVPGEASSFEVMRWCNSVGAVAFPRVRSVTGEGVVAFPRVRSVAGVGPATGVVRGCVL